jgi:hypothetical protein
LVLSLEDFKFGYQKYFAKDGITSAMQREAGPGIYPELAVLSAFMSLITIIV